MRILHPYTPNYRMDAQQHTFQALDVISSDFDSLPVSKLTINHCKTPNKIDAYEQVIIQNWGLDDLIICEQDIVPTTQDIKSLIECSCSVCVAAHYLYPCSIGGNHPVIAHRKWNGQKIEWLTEGERFADIVALGLIKIDKEVQQATNINLLQRGLWDSIDIRLSDLLRQAMARMADVRNPNQLYTPFHVHYPIVEHRHWRND